MSRRRAARDAAVAAIAFASTASAASLRPGAYAATASKAMVSSLHADLIAISEPDEQAARLLMSELHLVSDAVAKLKELHADATARTATAALERCFFEQRLAETEGTSSEAVEMKVAQQADEQEAEREVQLLRQQIDRLKSRPFDAHVVGEALTILRDSTEREEAAKRREVSRLERRLSTAHQARSRSDAQIARLERSFSTQCGQLCETADGFITQGQVCWVVPLSHVLASRDI